MLIATLSKTVTACLVAFALCPADAQAQWGTENRLVMKAPAIKLIATHGNAQQALPPRCRRGRRALIGALIGAGGTLPFVGVVHSRFENEAANGTAAAATAVALGAAAGAFIGLATCG